MKLKCEQESEVKKDGVICPRAIPGAISSPSFLAVYSGFIRQCRCVCRARPHWRSYSRYLAAWAVVLDVTQDFSTIHSSLERREDQE